MHHPRYLCRRYCTLPRPDHPTSPHSPTLFDSSSTVEFDLYLNDCYSTHRNSLARLIHLVHHVHVHSHSKLPIPSFRRSSPLQNPPAPSISVTSSPNHCRDCDPHHPPSTAVAPSSQSPIAPSTHGHGHCHHHPRPLIIVTIIAIGLHIDIIAIIVVTDRPRPRPRPSPSSLSFGIQLESNWISHPRTTPRAPRCWPKPGSPTGGTTPPTPT